MPPAVSFSSESDASYIHKFIRVSLIWYWISTTLFFFFGIIEDDLTTILAGCILIFWYYFTRALFKITKKREISDRAFSYLYIIFVFFLAVIEETVIYYNGGGLGGDATSLWHDLSIAVPVFVGISVGILLTHKIKSLTRGEFFILGAIQGFIIEIFIAGNILLFWFFGGGVLGMYGMMMACVLPKTPKINLAKSSIVKIVLGSILCFFMVILGAIVGDTIYNMG